MGYEISYCIIKAKIMSFRRFCCCWSIHPRLIIILKVLRMSLLSIQAQLQLPLSATAMRSNTSDSPPEQEGRGGEGKKKET